MSSNEGLPDLPDETDVRKRQFILIGLLIIVIGVVLAYALLTNPATQINRPTHQAPATIDYSTPGGSNDPIKNWVLQNENQMKAFNEQREKERAEYDAERLESQMQYKQLLAEIKRLKEGASDEITPETETGFPTIPLPPRSTLPTVPATQTVDGGTTKNLVDTMMMTPAATAKIVRINFTKKNKTKKPHIRDTIPAGSFGQAVLLSGLDAPTGGMAERNPHPVLLELIDNGNLPNKYRHKVKQCRVVGSGFGNISDERAYIRLERLTCVLRNGDIVSEVATGVVTGEDGKNGLRGHLVTKQGALIANAFWAGALSGMGEAIASSYTAVATTAAGTVSTLDPSRVTETGLASGVSNSMEKIADWYFKRAEETYPIIEISAGRIVNIFLTEDLSLNANLLANHTPETANE